MNLSSIADMLENHAAQIADDLIEENRARSIRVMRESDKAAAYLRIAQNVCADADNFIRALDKEYLLFASAFEYRSAFVQSLRNSLAALALLSKANNTQQTLMAAE